MKRGLIFSLWLCLAGGLMAWETMNLSEAWDKAEQHNPQLRQQVLSVDAARSQYRAESDEQLPKLYAKTGYQYISDVGTMNLLGRSLDMGVHDHWDLALGVQQPLFTGDRIRSQMAAAASDTSAARANYRLTRETLRLQIAGLFNQAGALDDQYQTLNSGIERADRQLRRLQSLLRAQQATPLDTLEIANHKLELETTRADNRHQYRILLAQIEELVGEPILPQGGAGIPPRSLDVADYQRQALENRAEFSLNAAKQTRLEEQKKIALSALYPQINATAEYHYGKPNIEVINPDWHDYYTVGVQLQWNAWDWGQAREKARVAEINRQQLVADSDRLQAQVTRQVFEAVEQLNSLMDRLTLQKQLTTQESVRRDVIENRCEQGQATSVDLRDADSKVTEAQLTCAQLTAQWQQAYYQLLYVTGILGGVR